MSWTRRGRKIGADRRHSFSRVGLVQAQESIPLQKSESETTFFTSVPVSFLRPNMKSASATLQLYRLFSTLPKTLICRAMAFMPIMHSTEIAWSGARPACCPLTAHSKRHMFPSILLQNTAFACARGPPILSKCELVLARLPVYLDQACARLNVGSCIHTLTTLHRCAVVDQDRNIQTARSCLSESSCDWTCL